MKKSVLFLSLLLFLQPLVSVVQAENLIPMGHTIEVELQLAQFFMTQNMRLESGDKLLVHDEVLTINGNKISTQSIADVNRKDKVQLTIKRKNEVVEVQCSSAEWQILRKTITNKMDGIGTLTYVTKNEKEFGAIGHQIAIGQQASFESGFIHLASIQSVIKSEKNAPGYKIIRSVAIEKNIANIQANSSYGVFGRWKGGTSLSVGKAYPTKQITEVQLGEAKMLTQIKENTVETFTINITGIHDQSFDFEIVDNSLMEATGGVIQGMSGSPILQDGYFIGAVTHMYVESPKKGAAISIMEMYKNAS